MSHETLFDVFVIGGGINGCGIARDAAGRGYSVYLAEMRDLASGTSSWSTKLIHGGLRYLEYYEFRLVREALVEREILWAMAPHIIWPLRFVLPYHRGMRPSWLLRLGLFLYDHIGGRKRLPATTTLDLTRNEAGRPLRPGFRRAFEYSDCWVDDARLVVVNARDAADRGASINTGARVTRAERRANEWAVTVEHAATGRSETVHARVLVNAAGPWVDEVLRGPLGREDARNVRLVQGSHIVVKRKYEHDRAYFFQYSDGRIFFAIPYEKDYTLIGTTDRDFDGEPGDVDISAEEIDYLCDGASSYFREPVTRSEIVWSYSGIRPLFDDGATAAQEASRDYVVVADDGAATLVNIFGGKITTYRRLAESVLATIEAAIGRRNPPWTAGATLPGGDFPVEGFEALVADLKHTHPFLEAAHARRLARLYGTAAGRIVGPARSYAELGQHFGADLYECEVRHLVTREWATTAEDILWRRTKLGLRLASHEIRALEDYLHKPASERRSQAAM